MNNKKNNWNVLSNHGLVLICLENYEDYPMRLISQIIGITERAVQRIVADLESEGYIEREKVGRKNRYRIHKNSPLRHAISGHCTVGEYLECFNADIESFVESQSFSDWTIGEHGSEMNFRIKES